MRRAVYPGTFDPITYGHLDVLRRAVALFDTVVVAILHNPGKRPLFSIEERIALVNSSVAELTGIEVDSFSGLLVDYCAQKQVDAVVRGIRGNADVQSEMQMAHMNESLFPSLQTVFLPARPEWSFVSSTLVKDVAMHGGKVDHLVATSVGEALKKKYEASS